MSIQVQSLDVMKYPQVYHGGTPEMGETFGVHMLNLMSIMFHTEVYVTMLILLLYA